MRPQPGVDREPRPSRALLVGHRPSPLGRSPFGAMVPSILSALAFGVLTVVWIVAGNGLPGGRWLAIHLFTLGVLTNLILAFSEHFGRTLTRQPAAPIKWQTTAANIGVVSVLIGLPTQTDALLAVGATTITAVVVTSYVRLRRMRHQALGARFAWNVRLYERAHGQFIHGAILGLLMGIGLLPGPWYVAARTAHMHINLLGWAGLTVLGTLVFFGPTMARTRIAEGADERAAKALHIGATGLTVGTLLLLGTALGGTGGVIARLMAATGIAVFAWATTVTCTAVAAAALTSNGSASRWPVVALCTWFPVVAWADVVVIATGQWRLLDALGLALVLGVLAQTIAAVMAYIVPMLRGRRFAGRDRLLARLERRAGLRTIAFNLGVATIVAATVTGGPAGAQAIRVGWAVVVAALAYVLAAAVLPLGPSAHAHAQPAVSAVARRYRDR